MAKLSKELTHFLKYGDQNSVGNGNGNADVHSRRL